MKYFTSDWHLGEDRIGVNGKPDLFYRPFTSTKIQDTTITENFLQSGFVDGDEFFHLGDVVYDIANDEAILNLVKLRDEFPSSVFTLIVGNYDEGIERMNILENYFDVIEHEKIIEIKNQHFYLNHYPIKCVDKKDHTKYPISSVDKLFSLTGHIHGLWKVQKNMINVGVDAWHFKPVNEDTILFCRTAVEKYYDKNVFPY